MNKSNSRGSKSTNKSNYWFRINVLLDWEKQFPVAFGVLYNLYWIYSVYSVYWVYSVYSVYSVYWVNSVYSVYSVYRVNSVYSVYSVYSVCILYVLCSLFQLLINHFNALTVTLFINTTFYFQIMIISLSFLSHSVQSFQLITIVRKYSLSIRK